MIDTEKKSESIKWIGRFAPSPSGPLHFGSLVAALGSYLVAKKKKGDWLLRIEDIDPPREVSGAAESIVKTLEAFGFEWTGPVLFQSERFKVYQNAFETLKSKKLVYHCSCSRKEVLQRNKGVYDAYCRGGKSVQLANAAWRVIFDNSAKVGAFNDQILGLCHFEQAEALQDFVIRRRDGLFAYQLAVVVDDIEQQVSHVVRGADILNSTPRQNYLYHCFGAKLPIYFHLPLVVTPTGEKYSKSLFSAAVKSSDASVWLVKALNHLDQATNEELKYESPADILKWAIDHWQVSKVAKKAKIFEGNL